jgi:MYXO-CTERM domain-containing protein
MLSPTFNLNVTSASPVQSQGSIYFSPFGSGQYTSNVITNVSGSNFFVYLSGIAVAQGYTSGGALSATGTISGDFASRGITVGTSTTEFRLGNVTGGAANTLIVQRSVASASVPDQMPTAALGAGVVLMGLAARRRRR